MVVSVEEEMLRKKARPIVAQHDAKAVLKQVYGIPSATSNGNDNDKSLVLTALPSYDDVNYKVQVGTSDGNNISSGTTTYIFKCFNGVDSQNLAYIEGIQRTARHLLAKGVKCTVPLPIHGTAKDEFYSQMELPTVSAGQKSLVVSLMTWVDGIPMSEMGDDVTPELLVKCGELLGDVDVALTDFNHDALTRPMQWDLACTADLEQFFSYIKDEEQRAVAHAVIAAFKKEVLPCAAAGQLRSSVIHGDFNDGNIIVNEKTKEIAGLIDFGDACRTWSVNEIAIGMAYAMVSKYAQRSEDYLGSAALLLRGYVNRVPLPAVESKHLRTLVACRLVMSMTLGAYSFAQQPDNLYLLTHATPCWNALKALWCEVPDVHTRALWEKAIMKVPAEVLLRVSVSMWRGDKRKDRGPLSVTFITGNVNKLKEVQTMMGDELPFTLSSQKVDLPELQGDPDKVAIDKCKIASQQIAGPVLVEDTGLCFVSLGGMPGPYIKWFLDKTGHDGLNKLLVAHEDKSAYAQCIFAFSPGPGREVKLFEGRTMGKIVPARGPIDFGWDPVFEPNEGRGRTFAEMSKEDKNAISHRGRALEKLKKYLVEFAEDWN